MPSAVAGSDPSAAAAAGAPALPSDAVDSWLAIAQDGGVTVFTDKVELGMGVSTAFAQIVAEELDVPVRSISLVLGDTARTPDQGGVGGSTSISVGSRPVRQAAAEGRRVLLNLASARLGAPVDQLTVKDGVVRRTDDPSKGVSYGDLIGGRRFDVTLQTSGSSYSLGESGTATPKDPSKYTVVGTAVPRFDIPAKATAQFTYIVDVRVPGMVHGRVIRPPVPGAKLVRIDGADGLPGVVKVVAKGNFVGVVAQSEWQAIQAAKALKVTWSTSTATWPSMTDLYTAMWAMSPTMRRTMAQVGDVDAAIKAGSRTVEARYEWPFQAHAMMGPGCAVADVRDGGATIWSSTQHPHQLQRGVAELVGVPASAVHVIWVEGAGSYGRSGAEDVPGDAALLSQAVGRPVRVQWMRADDTAWDPKGPPVVMAVRAGFDGSGAVVGWDYTARAFSGNA
jgi:CO/xanthine dehydrogenase Mo-binding subunit